MSFFLLLAALFTNGASASDKAKYDLLIIDFKQKDGVTVDVVPGAKKVLATYNGHTCEFDASSIEVERKFDVYSLTLSNEKDNVWASGILGPAPSTTWLSLNHVSCIVNTK